MNIQRARSVDELLPVLTHPAILDAICEDGAEFNPDSLDLDKDCWLTAGDYAVIYLRKTGCITVDVHVHFLPESRGETAVKTIKAFYRWFLENTPFRKLTAEVPECYPNVSNFCLKMGMTAEGINRSSYLKNGEELDQVNLGITRAEIEHYLEAHNGVC